jgi:DNA polymerase-1
MAKSKQQRLPGLESDAPAVPPDARATAPCADPDAGLVARMGADRTERPAEATEPVGKAASKTPDLKGKTVYVVDSHSLIFQVFHAMPEMTGPKGQPTGAVFGFTRDLIYLLDQKKPDYLLAAFDLLGPTFRHELFTAYKEQRSEMPSELVPQIPNIRRMLAALGIPVLDCEGFEADDILATVARMVEQAGGDCLLVTGDKDCRQLISDRVGVFNIRKNLIFDAAALHEEWGIRPEQVVDFQTLVGDAVDNIPGAPGIGDKGAKDLIERFGSVEAALERAAEIEKKTHRESLQNNAERVRMSKRLATIATDVPIKFSPDALKAQAPDPALLKAIYKEMEFHSLLKELGPSDDTRTRDYRVVASAAELDAWLAAAKGAPVAVAISKMAEGQFALDSIGLAWKPGEARAVAGEYLPALKGWIEDGAHKKVACDVKSASLQLGRMGMEARGFDEDIMLYAFLLDADPGGCALEEQARRRMDLKLGAAPEQHADMTLELWQRLSPAVDERGLRKLYDEIDLPMAGVLARMERAGVRIDSAELRRLSGLMETEIARLTADVHGLANRTFNISSPQQLAVVLFDEMALKGPKNRSTAADVLEELAADHEIVRKVLEYRQLTKLKGTYVDALPALIDPATGRLHTSFNAAGAATGRLSSSNPNLQNIPIRTALGREIRAAFVPREGWKLVVADYSQIELRLLAHMSGDEVLVRAYREGEDIHTRTAAEVMGVPPMMVTAEARRDAKAVNFGIVYGISSFGLAANLGISRGEADQYIKNYFARYTGVKRFIEETIAEVRQTGVTRTLFGRERPIPDINSRNPSARGFAERTAVNSPLQGTAADLIKVAMVRIDAELGRSGMESTMLLQVHDELVFESPPGEVDALAAMVKREMESAYELTVPLVADTGVGPNWRDAK